MLSGLLPKKITRVSCRFFSYAGYHSPDPKVFKRGR